MPYGMTLLVACDFFVWLSALGFALSGLALRLVQLALLRKRQRERAEREARTADRSRSIESKESRADRIARLRNNSG